MKTNLRLALILSLFALSVPPGSAAAGDPAHELMLCVSVSSRGQVIGSRARAKSGLYRTTDRRELTHLGYNHPRIDSVARDPHQPGMLLAVGLNGVLRLREDGTAWRILTGWEMTEAKKVVVDPTVPGRVYAALPDGIALSEDGGLSWRRSNEGIVRRYTQALVLDRSAPARLIAGTERGIFLSEDRAATWRPVLPARATVNDVRQSPHDPKVLVAATQSDGAWRSADGGRTWSRMEAVPLTSTLHNIDVDATNARRMALSGWGVGVLVTEDGGATWVPRNAGLPNTNVWRVGIDPDFPGRLYCSPHESAIHVSEDFGRTWKPLWFEAVTVWDFVFLPRR